MGCGSSQNEESVKTGDHLAKKGDGTTTEDNKVVKHTTLYPGQPQASDFNPDGTKSPSSNKPIQPENPEGVPIVAPSHHQPVTHGPEASNVPFSLPSQPQAQMPGAVPEPLPAKPMASPMAAPLQGPPPPQQQQPVFHQTPPAPALAPLAAPPQPTGLYHSNPMQPPSGVYHQQPQQPYHQQQPQLAPAPMPLQQPSGGVYPQGPPPPGPQYAAQPQPAPPAAHGGLPAYTHVPAPPQPNHREQPQEPEAKPAGFFGGIGNAIGGAKDSVVQGASNTKAKVAGLFS